ncbi:reverse transcriptase domain-containing protein [Tanacetum coccineum]
MTGIPRFVAERELKTYPHIEPRVQRKRSIAPDKRNVVKEEVEEWLKSSIMKRVWLKNAVATYQRLVDNIFEGQIRRNLEAYVDHMAIKSKIESDLIKDIEETLLKLKKDAVEEAFQKMQKLIAEIPTLTAPMKGEELMVYLSTANEAVRSVLLVERRARQMPIHYVCRSLQGVEVNYAPMEKLALALVHADRRLRRYFQGHTIKVIMKKPINQILNSREASGRLAKWAVELGAYGITYVPSNAIKGQVLADFLDDTMAGDDPTSKGTTKTKKILEPDEDPKSSRSKEEQTVVGLIDDTNTWKMYIDGASNDHGSGAGLILIDPKGMEYSYTL